ncbi:bifunctional folylpolyglutamate synthase/dihydrofolate synthase [Chitinophaga nivalis]|uniref:Dihydrofolate synthase/folylpolyglutamate synthase n=1 Tax=Chitinophaga nivalis TaxID=2991709 RepID=A0ABT3IHN8_9BACT|nr:folylpolyglutamate synthase/dihydrofolate synthase family protein [Chitinophaga nivalis]MCW3466842.1 bifunctional folylpolyglutamate synthase/dihydrofolate synthase [Chitinophaga nivalis]MCW3483467.1 bifunctional folylpolyglutamate synthase/dihydrofolate synthase [Chitinophaga nivalis]
MDAYKETVAYLYEQLPMFTRVGATAYKEDLHNTLALLEQVNNPHQHFRSIHVAGTNGKGSSSHMLAAIFQEAGYKTGLYTSPHLLDFRERIRINGAMVPESFVVDFTRQIQTHIDHIQPSFFELTVAMAFSYFAQEKVDIAIIETGLGGRLDSTNVITPELSLITNISYDHKNILGDTLEKIAGEKAGIIKSGVPVVISETQAEIRHVFEQTAAAKAAPIHFADQEWMVDGSDITSTHLALTLMDIRQQQMRHIKLDLNGQYQEKNVMGVLSAARVLQEKGWQLHTDQVIHALTHVKKLTGVRGRWEVIQQHPLTVLDVGHNEAGIREIMEQLRHMNYQQLHIVVGFVKDKEVEKVLPLFPATAHYYFCKAQLPRALDENELAEQAAHSGLQGHPYPSVQAALQAARQHAQPDDMILVCGSFFVVAEVM